MKLNNPHAIAKNASCALLTVMCSALMSGCTWVKLSEGGETVTVVAAADGSCKKLGSTLSTTKADIASIDRGASKVATELETLARNAAAEMGGNTISPETEVSQAGSRRYGIYRCDS